MRLIHAGIFATMVISGGVALADDNAFLTQALATNRIELALGRLASERATTPEVQAMAQKMIQKHTELGQQLSVLAAQSGVRATAETTPSDKETLSKLGALPRGEFDAAFKGTIDDIHRHELAFYEDEVKGASNGELRSLAERRVAALRKNLVAQQPKQEKDW
jgi:putative membrane protein